MLPNAEKQPDKAARLGPHFPAVNCEKTDWTGEI